MKTEEWGRPAHLPDEGADAKKYTGSSSQILRGKQVPPFAKGTMGMVTQERISVTHNDKERAVDLVTKYFTQQEGPDSLDSSMAAYKVLREAGLKHIPTTYRQVGPHEVLMTDYNHGERVAVGGGRNEKAKGLKIASITNLPELLSSIADDLQRASQAKIHILSDNYFFIVPAAGGDATVDFVIGDLGGIWRFDTTDKNHRRWVDENVTRAALALRGFVLLHVAKEKREEYDAEIVSWAKDLNEKVRADALASGAMDRGV